jgi:cbb3-type cytochrome oxidase subunit 3
MTQEKNIKKLMIATFLIIGVSYVGLAYLYRKQLK